MSDTAIDSPHKRKSASINILPPIPDSSESEALDVPADQPSRPKVSAGRRGATVTFATDSDFLTALAAQERKVLELKEDLKRAEAELEQLKKGWASHEATKRRNEGRRLHQMRPMSMSATQSSKTLRHDDNDGSSSWMYAEMERRKALLGRIKPTQRRTFSGGHTKRLSLLEIQEQETSSERSSADLDRSRAPQRASTTPDLLGSSDRKDSRSPQRDAFIRTSKQVASDLRDGLWTFFEDLKHVATGDEARTTKPSVAKRRDDGRQDSTAIERKECGSLDLIDVGGSFWRDSGLEEPAERAVAKVKHEVRTLPTPQKNPLRVRDEGGEWDSWESPLPRNQPTTPPSSNDSNSQAGASPATLASSPRTSMSDAGDARARLSVGSSKGIPWPQNLAKLSPSQLRRTASSLVEEWERSVTPPSESQDNP